MAPLIYGRRKGHPRLALSGFAGCLAAGLIGGLYLAAAVCVVYMFYLYRRAKGEAAPAMPDAEADIGTAGQGAETWAKLKHIRLRDVFLASVFVHLCAAASGWAGYGFLAPAAGLLGYYLLALWLYIRCDNLGVSGSELFPSIPGNFNWSAMGGGPLLAVIFSLSYFVYLDIQAPVTDKPSAMMLHSLSFEFVGMAILAAPVEEILFRGILLHHLAQRWGINKSIVVGSVVFLLAHLAVSAAIFAVSLMLYCLFLKTGSLRTPVIFHAVCNVAIIALYALMYAANVFGAVAEDAAFWAMIMSGAGLAGWLYVFWPRGAALPWTGRGREEPGGESSSAAG